MSIGARINAELRGDKAIWGIIAVLMIFSVLAVYSSTGTLAYRLAGGNTEYYLMKHLGIILIGIFLTYGMHLLHYKRYSDYAPYLLLLSIPLLLFTLAFAPDINEARRWLKIPYVGVSFQSSELAKLALIIYVARKISAKQDYIKDFKSAFLPIIVPILIVVGLIAPADLSTAIMLFTTCILLMFVGRVALNYIALLLVLGFVVFAMLVFLEQVFPEVIRVETWARRLNEFLHTDGGYQVKQTKIAIANGEVIGLGPGNSIQRNFLPNAFSDSIYGIICEEYGVIGGAFIILLYVLLFFRATRLVTKSSKSFGAMVVMGLTIGIIIQAFINIAVAVNLLPVTGLPLPLLSMGGTSILFTYMAFGIILSVSRFIES